MPHWCISNYFSFNKMFVFILFSFILKGEMSHPETTKTEDVRQCALCQQYGDSATSVSKNVLLCFCDCK